MKCQSLFSEKIKKSIILLSAGSSQRAVMLKLPILVSVENAVKENGVLASAELALWGMWTSLGLSFPVIH